MPYVTTSDFIEEMPDRDVYTQFFETSNVAILSWVWNEATETRRLAWVVGLAEEGYRCKKIENILNPKHIIFEGVYKFATPIDEKEAERLRRSAISPTRFLTISLISIFGAVGTIWFGFREIGGVPVEALPFVAIASGLLIMTQFIIHGLRGVVCGLD